MSAKKSVEDRRRSRTEEVVIDERNVKWGHDGVDQYGKPKHFAKGSFGFVFRVGYQGDICVAKVVNLNEVPENQLEATKKEYKKVSALLVMMVMFWVEI
jgi:hypothetical protein